MSTGARCVRWSQCPGRPARVRALQRGHRPNHAGHHDAGRCGLRSIASLRQSRRTVPARQHHHRLRLARSPVRTSTSACARHPQRQPTGSLNTHRPPRRWPVGPRRLSQPFAAPSPNSSLQTARTPPNADCGPGGSLPAEFGSAAYFADYRTGVRHRLSSGHRAYLIDAVTTASHAAKPRFSSASAAMLSHAVSGRSLRWRDVAVRRSASVRRGGRRRRCRPRAGRPPGAVR